MGSTVFLFAARSAASCPYAGSQEDLRRRRIGCVPYHAMLSCLEASSSLESSRRILFCSMQKFEPWIVRDRDGFCGAIAGDGQKICSECHFGRPKYFGLSAFDASPLSIHPYSWLTTVFYSCHSILNASLASRSLFRMQDCLFYLVLPDYRMEGLGK
jgi:hypothetical protein